MKKVLLTALFSFVMLITASAQQQKYYFIHVVGHEEEILSGWFIIDMEKKQYIPESDSEVLNEIKNYKKAGDKETFDLYEDGNFINSVEISKDEKGFKTITHIYKTESGVEKSGPIAYGTKDEWNAEYEKKYGKKPSGDGEADENVGESPVGKAKGKVKGLLNKGKNLFKKKK